MQRSSYRRIVSTLAILLSLGTTAFAAPDITGKLYMGSGGGTDHKPQSKLWFNDGTWWAILYDGGVQRIWKFDGGVFVRETYPDAAVDGRATARADVLWDGTYLYVLLWHDTLPRFSQYSYDSSTQTYHLLPGFPVDLPIPGTEVMVFDKDSSGRIYASFELDLDVHVIWTTTPDHLSWNLTGAILESHVDADDITTTVAFGGDKIGVLWSDQSADATWDVGFRVHRDVDPPDVWQPKEIIAEGSAVDDHLNLKTDSYGRLYFASKDLYNSIHLYVREVTGGWRLAAADLNSGNATRPVVEVDEASNSVHVFYTDWIESPNPIKKITAPLSTLAFGSPSTFLSPDSGVSLNDVTGSKHPYSKRTGMMIAASSGSSAHWGFVNLDTDTPVLTGVDPAADQAGVSLQPLLQVRVTDAGMGVRRTSIQMTLDGVPVTPTTAGNASEYLLAYSPTVPLQNNRIYSIGVHAEDYAYPPHVTDSTLRFRTEMIPGPLAKKINFQPATGAAAPGYDVDAGLAFSLDAGTGWDKTMTMKRAGVNADVRLDTYVERRNSSSIATWAYDVANGLYNVTFVAGAPNASGKQRVAVEGEVLLNNQVTASGQFLTISDYPVAVRDGRLSVSIGGAGGSTKTQLCFIEFTYAGEAPPPPPPSGDEAAPRPVTGVTVARSGSDLELHWATVMQDTTGAIISIARYDVYRGTTPNFLPDRTRHANRVGMVTGTSYTDLGAANASTDLYYIVTAERSSGLESQHGSNLGIRRRIVLTPPAGGTLAQWIAFPYTTSFGNARGLVASLNGGTGAGPVVAVAKVDRESQLRQVWSYASGAWSGTDFTILPGEACEITAAQPLTWNLVGSESSDPVYGFAFHTAVGNVNWISLPQNATLTDARALVQSMNGGPGGAPISKLAWYNPATAQMESYLYLDGAWRGTNFTVQRGSGLAVIGRADLPLWRPRLAAQ